ncbi:MAG: biopolymer transporter ExbD [Acidobacteria bacterium]|nr:biopolymer transporter ExbD [Acidobacteriota bacterium]
MATLNGGNSRVSGVTSDINVTPMADIMLVLLIIFMIATPMLQEGIYVDMAKAQNAEVAQGAIEKDVTTVALTRDEKVYWNHEEIGMDQLEERLAELMAKSPEKPIFVKSDAAVKYGRVVETLNKARDAGVERVGLLVEHETRSTDTKLISQQLVF